MAAIVVPLAALFLVIGLFLAVRSRSVVSGPPGLLGEAGIRKRALALRDQLDRTPFGAPLARQVWRKLTGCPVGEGHVHSFHRDFCGQGLIRTEEGVKLCDIQDGGYLAGPAIAAWHSESGFVAFFSGQSDFSCSGWDGTSAVFATDDEWYRNNQRLTREGLLVFIASARDQ